MTDKDPKVQLEAAETSLAQAEDRQAQYEQQIVQLQEQLAKAQSSLKEAQSEVSSQKEAVLQLQLLQPSSWNDSYRKLLAYKEKHGNTNVPHKYKEDPSLGRFVGNQRVFYKYYQNGDTKHLKAHRIDALNRIGFIWDIKEHHFQQRLKELKKFIEDHGHSLVPRGYPNSKFRTWVEDQRSKKKALKRGECSLGLTPERIQAMDDLGFEWEPFRPQNPMQYRKSTEKSKRTKPLGKLAPSTLEALNPDIPFEKLSSQTAKNIRFAHSTPDQVWEIRWQQMLEFKERHGHLEVNKRSLTKPRKYPGANQLITWMAHLRNQHEYYREGKPSILTGERVAALAELGFKFRKHKDEPRKNTGKGNGIPRQTSNKRKLIDV